MHGLNLVGQKSMNRNLDLILLKNIFLDFSVEYTVPLIRKMESKILVPLKSSPMQ
jgi:chemotaxis methyl-accepting protein methylase